MADHNFPTNPLAKWSSRLLGRSGLERKPTSTPAGDDPEFYQARVEAINCPAAMTAGETYRIDFRIRNESPVTWPSPDIGIPSVVLTYHWLRPSGETYHYAGHQSRLPGTVPPGGTTELAALVQAPADAGHYLLQWDLLMERVAWFTTRGWQGPVSEVNVLEDTLPLTQHEGQTLGLEEPPLVSVVIPCFNQAHFLGEAIDSALRQSDPRVEILVIDDGSTDDTHQVAARYPAVRYHYQANQGLAAARNAGIHYSTGDLLVFLDADDRLLPDALQTGVAALQEHPEAAFVAGHHRLIDEWGAVCAQWPAHPIERDHYTAFLEGNFIGMHATVMYRRTVFERVGGFDTSLQASEDYDLYFRIARRYPIHCHPHLIAEYRQHQANMTRRLDLMLRSAVGVLRSQRPIIGRNDRQLRAYKNGLRFVQWYYGDPLVDAVRQRLRRADVRSSLPLLKTLARFYPAGALALITPRIITRAGMTRIERIIQDLVSQQDIAQREIARLRTPTAAVPVGSPPLGAVNLGDLRRTAPISTSFGFDRGQPVDRYYIKQFLAAHAGDIRGRVLEIGDNSYTKRFGGDRVTASEVLHVVEGNPVATIVGDLSRADHIPSSSFDCVILTQTIHLVFDVSAAIRTLHRILKPGGVALVTAPGISQISNDEWRNYWYWSFTELSLRRLFEQAFSPGSLQLQTSGNVLAATAFLQGLAAEELRGEEIEHHDQSYPVTITLRAVKAPMPAVASGDRKQSGAILLYHQISDHELDPWSLAVRPAQFDQHLRVLGEHACPLSLSEFVELAKENRLPARAVAVTFDDGYADNLFNAKLLLETHHVPATVFIATGYLGGEHEFWWDELARLLLLPGNLPETLTLQIDGRTRQWALSGDAAYSESDYLARHSWQAWQSPPGPRQALYRALWELLQPLSEAARRTVINQLIESARASSAPRPSHRPLSRPEALALADGGLVEIGAHAVTHSVLAGLSIEEQGTEVRASKAELEALLARSVTSFAYPFGGSRDYTQQTVEIVREAEFALACTNSPGFVNQDAHPLALPRFHVPACNADQFTWQLSEWFDGRV